MCFRVGGGRRSDRKGIMDSMEAEKSNAGAE